MTMPLCGTGGDSITLPAGTSEALIFDASVNGGPCRAYKILNQHATVTAKIRVKGMHLDQSGSGGTDGMATLAAGESQIFTFEHNCIEKITGYGNAADTTIRGEVVSRD